MARTSPFGACRRDERPANYRRNTHAPHPLPGRQYGSHRNVRWGRDPHAVYGRLASGELVAKPTPPSAGKTALQRGPVRKVGSVMRFSRKLSITAGVVASTVAAGVAFAYWTTSGSGDGQATAAASNGVVVLHGSFDAGIYPGGEKSVSFTADNAGATDLRVGTIHLASVSTNQPSCVVADFSMDDVTS